MAATPESLTEQQMQPLAREIHSSTCWPSLLTVRDFSMSAESPNSGGKIVVRMDGGLIVAEEGERSLGKVQAVQYDCDLLAVLFGENVVK
jgi:hypothetical protein